MILCLINQLLLPYIESPVVIITYHQTKPLNVLSCNASKQAYSMLTALTESNLSIKAFLPTLLMLWTILAMTLLLERNIKRAEKAAIKLIFNKSQLITFLCVCMYVCTGCGWG